VNVESTNERLTSAKIWNLSLKKKLGVESRNIAPAPPEFRSSLVAHDPIAIRSFTKIIRNLLEESPRFGITLSSISLRYILFPIR